MAETVASPPASRAPREQDGARGVVRRGGARRGGARGGVVRIGLRSAATLAIVSLTGLAMFLWPLVVQVEAGVAHHRDAVFVFVLTLPMLVVLVLSQLSDGVFDSKALAMLGVLSALGAALRPVGAGIGGIELVFFLLVLAGRVYGPGFGFVLGSTTMFASAILTGGVGPWLPFQMLAASWVGLGAGLLPRCRGRVEIALLTVYGIVSAYAYGFLMNMWFWPFTADPGSQVAFVPGAAVVDNLRRFVVFTIATSTIGWDTGRALTNGVVIATMGAPVLLALRRAARRAAFSAPVRFREADTM